MRQVQRGDEVEQVTFGTILREARERKGYDLATAARRLRIRPDILHAIEDDDFSRMPPRGYARNMVNAYARLVGLNPTEMTRMYLDEAYAYQVGRARGDAQPSRFDRGSSPRRSGSVRPRERAAQQAAERPPRQNAFGRAMYDDRRDFGRDYGTRTEGTGRAYSQERTHASRHTALPNAHYTNFYAGPKAPNVVQSKLPLFIAGGVILVLLVLVLVFAFGNRGGGSTEEVAKVPITGVTDTSQTEEGSADTKEEQPQVATVTVPTSVNVVYKVASGQEVYAVITADGTATEQMITGPVEETVSVTGTWSIATWVSDAVSVTVDGKAVTFDSSDSSGMPLCSVDFDAWLAQWKTEHPDAKAADASVVGAKTDTTGTTTDSTTGSSAT